MDDAARGVPTTVAQAVLYYYNETLPDYLALWSKPGSLAMHFAFDGPGVRTHLEGLDYANDVLANHAGITAGMRVLDAGCGLGGSAAWLALHRQAHVTGVTLVPDQVVRARAHAERMGVADRTEFRVGDFTATGLEAGTYDIVWCFEALCHAPDKSAFYREAARLLRPGGRIIIAEYIRARRPLAAPSEERLRRWVAGWAIPDLDTPEEHMEAAAEAGFSRLIMHDITRLTRRSLRRVCVTACALWPGHRLARRLGLRSEAHEGNIYGAIRQYPSLRRGDWFYSIIVGTR